MNEGICDLRFRPAVTNLKFDIADCIARVRLGDEAAARSLVEYLSPTVLRIVRGKLPRGAVEEDLRQEIFVKVFEKLHQYKGEVPLEHWVSRIAVNHALNAIRSQKARPEWRMADLPEEQEAALARELRTADHSQPSYAMASRELVESILETLSPDDQVLIRKLDVEEFTIAEVQQATGWSASYIRLRAFRARKKLSKRFSPTGRRRKNSSSLKVELSACC
jgi:RNA polymerase sigma factor (sigma-70 family)